MSAPVVVELHKLSKRFYEGQRQRVVFNDVDATIYRGERVALVGRSGTGKSTLLNLISGIDLPSSGEVVVDGVVINRLSEHARTVFRRQKIGFIFQFFNLIPTLTVAENLMLPLELNGKVSPSQRDQVGQLSERVGMSQRLDSYPDRLSGGEQQRIAIARALVHRPRLLLADEPTGNLDSDTSAQVLQLMEQMAGEHDMTLIVVTHSAEVAHIAHRILTIQDGTVVAGAGV